MKQHAATFGPGGALVGVLTEPARPDPKAPVLLLFNAGLVPRQGPHRMNVRIAHALAEIGLASFRLDLSGLGDSRHAGAGGDGRAQAVEDLQAAMDWLQQSRGARRFLVFGVCSGAVNAYDVALADPRVTGVFMFDGFWHRSRWTTLMRLLKRARAMGVVKLAAAAAKRLRSLGAKGEKAPSDAEIFFDYSENPTVQAFAEAMQSLVDRGVDVSIAYSGSVTPFYSYEAQFRHVFGGYPFFRDVRCGYYPDIDHVFETQHAQKRMIAIVAGWFQAHVEQYGAARRAAPEETDADANLTSL